MGEVSWTVSCSSCEYFKEWLKEYFPAVLEDKSVLMKDHPRAKVACRAGMVIKQTIPRPGLRTKLKCLVRQPQAANAFELGISLSRAGIAVAEPIAWGSSPSGDTYQITREIENARTLDEWIIDAKVDAAEKMSIIAELGRLLGSLHNAGFSNRDLKNTNILCRSTAKGFDVYAIDLDGVRRRRHIAKRVVLRDMWCILHALAVFNWDNEETRRVILHEYCQSTGKDIALDELVPFSVPGKPVRPDWKCSVIRTGWSGFSKRRLVVHSVEPHEAWTQALHTEWLYRVFEKGARTRPIPDEPVEIRIPGLDKPIPVLLRHPTPQGFLGKKTGPSVAAEVLKNMKRNDCADDWGIVPIALVEEIVKGRIERSGLLLKPAEGQISPSALNGLASLRNEIMAQTRKM